jgi:hypothetical protein
MCPLLKKKKQRLYLLCFFSFLFNTGAIHLNDCPAERMIPIYLIVGGSFGILKNLLSIGQRCKNRDEEDSDEKNTKPNPVDGIVGCFLLAWFIAGR